MPPAPAPREALKTLPVPVDPVRPSADSALPVPEMLRSAAVPVLMFSAPVTIDDLVSPVVVVRVAVPLVLVAVCTPVARSIAFVMSATVAASR